MAVSRIFVLGRAALCAAVFAGCVSSAGSPAAVGVGGHAAFPLLLLQGGPLVTTPKIVSVTFAGDSMASSLQLFGESVTSSAWWDTVRVGYCASGGASCVGDGLPGTFVALGSEAAPSYTDSDSGGSSSLQSWLSAAIAGGSLPRPDPDTTSNTIYVLYIPSTTTIALDEMASCVDGGFDGYHNWMTMGSQSIPYAVVMECAPLPPPFPSIPAITRLQNTTITAAHEIVEAATDPVPPSGYALDPTDTNNWGWIDLTGGGEAADLCVDPFGMNQDQTLAAIGDGGAPFTVQRIWSARQAAAGVDPCNPTPAGGTYFNAAPRQTFFIIGVGQSATFEVDAFSGDATSDWTLTAQDWSASTNTSYLTFSIAGGEASDAGPQVQVHDGSAVEVTVTLMRDPGELDTGEADGSIISYSGSPDSPAAAHYWPIAVMSPGDAADAGIGLAPSTGRNVRLVSRPGPALRRPAFHHTGPTHRARAPGR